MHRYTTDPLAIFQLSSPLYPGGFPNFLGAGSGCPSPRLDVLRFSRPALCCASTCHWEATDLAVVSGGISPRRDPLGKSGHLESRADGGSVWSTTGFQGEIWHKEMPRQLWARGRCGQKTGMHAVGYSCHLWGMRWLRCVLWAGYRPNAQMQLVILDATVFEHVSNGGNGTQFRLPQSHGPAERCRAALQESFGGQWAHPRRRASSPRRYVWIWMGYEWDKNGIWNWIWFWCE